MPRLTREESRAVTRGRLLASAKLLFRRDGYATTAVERIADQAGYSKGAVYSNFESKEAIFLAVLEAQGRESLDELLAQIGGAPDWTDVVELLAGWADERSRSGSWALTILEHARYAAAGAPSLRRQEEILRGHWCQLGEGLLARLPGITVGAETLGALLHEIAYAPAMTFMRRPTAGELMRVALHGIGRVTA